MNLFNFFLFTSPQHLTQSLKKSDRVNSAGYTVYIERNQWVIDDSDFIISYLDENKNQIFSGTNVVYEYAKKKSKEIALVKQAQS